MDDTLATYLAFFVSSLSPDGIHLFSCNQGNTITDVFDLKDELGMYIRRGQRIELRAHSSSCDAWEIHALVGRALDALADMVLTGFDVPSTKEDALEYDPIKKRMVCYLPLKEAFRCDCSLVVVHSPSYAMHITFTSAGFRQQ